MKTRNPKLRMKTAMEALLDVNVHLRRLESEAADAGDSERQLVAVVAQERMQDALDLLNLVSKRAL